MSSGVLAAAEVLLKNIHKKQFRIWQQLGFEHPSHGEMSLMTIENLMCEASKYIALVQCKNENISSNRRRKYRKRTSIDVVLEELAGEENGVRADTGQTEWTDTGKKRKLT